MSSWGHGGLASGTQPPVSKAPQALMLLLIISSAFNIFFLRCCHLAEIIGTHRLLMSPALLLFVNIAPPGQADKDALGLQIMGFHVPAPTAKVLAMGLVCFCMYVSTLFSSFASEEELDTVNTIFSNSER